MRRKTMVIIVLFGFVMLAALPTGFAQDADVPVVSLAQEIREFMTRRKDDLSPRVKKELAAILDRHEKTLASGQSEQIPKKSKFRIDAPKEKARVTSRFIAKGSLGKLPPKTHAWLAIKRGSLYWPKESDSGEIKATAGKWESVVYEGGAPGKMDLVLLQVSEDGQLGIKEWLKVGKKTGSFPGLRIGQLDGKILAIAKKLQYR